MRIERRIPLLALLALLGCAKPSDDYRGRVRQRYCEEIGHRSGWVDVIRKSLRWPEGEQVSAEARCRADRSMDELLLEAESHLVFLDALSLAADLKGVANFSGDVGKARALVHGARDRAAAQAILDDAATKIQGTFSGERDACAAAGYPASR